MTIYDATKEELIQYFFNPLAGGVRVGASKDNFLLWLRKKRAGEQLDTMEQTADASNRALCDYLDLVKAATCEQNITVKLNLYEKANKAYAQYEKLNKAYDAANKKFDESWCD